jgi:hypothetical protein
MLVCVCSLLALNGPKVMGWEGEGKAERMKVRSPRRRRTHL